METQIIIIFLNDTSLWQFKRDEAPDNDVNLIVDNS